MFSGLAFGLWLVAVVILIMVLQYCEQRASLRGCHRVAMDVYIEKGLRVFFLCIFVGPLYFIFSWAIIPIVLLYLPSYLDGSELDHGRPSKYVKSSFLMGIFKRRMNLKLVRTEKIDPNGQYIFGVHPHAILPFGGMVNLMSDLSNFDELFPGVQLRGLAASFAFYIPLWRDFLLGGGICDAARYVATNLLNKNYSIVVVPGGATEALYSEPSTNVLYLKKRRGFVKLALETGASLVPVYSFNETETYDTVSMHTYPTLAKMKIKFQGIFGLSLPLATNIIPKKCEITTVVGKPIKVEKIEKPTSEDIEKTLEIYIQAVEELFENNYAKYNCQNNLQII